MTNLVVCCDGTWNVPDEEREKGGPAEPTNVAKLALALAKSPTQSWFYEPGVGTSPGEHLLGGATGYGLSRNILNAYRWLVRHYTPAAEGREADRIFLFGFSRGAYTARSLAGLIRNSGLLTRDADDRLLGEAFDLYRDRSSSTHPSAIASTMFRRAHGDDADSPPIHFVGVWDTVGALGIPDDLPGWDVIAKVLPQWHELWGFHDTELSSRVTHAFHALSIDEERPPYKPTLWTQGGGRDPEKFQQVWFAGVHSEVGGGTPDHSLADVAYLWLVGKAKAAGLELAAGQPEAGAPDLGVPGPRPDPLGHLSPGLSGPIWTHFHPYHRLLRHPPEDGENQLLSTSAVDRARAGVDYDPRGLKDRIDRGDPTADT